MVNRILRIGGSEDSQTTSKGPLYIDLNTKAKQVLDEDKIAHYELDTLNDFKAVMNSLKNIFSWIPGERVINPEFGSQIRRLLYDGITNITEERIVAEIKRSVSRWEPRATITDIINVSTIEDTEDNIIRLDIKFTVKGLDDVYTYEYVQNNSK